MILFDSREEQEKVLTGLQVSILTYHVLRKRL